MDTVATRLREARVTDADRMTDLAEQLGYPLAPGELAERLPLVASTRDAVVLVAVDEDDLPIGWIHVELKPTLLAPLAALVMGLVVDEAARSRGVGARLLERGEAWARERGCHAMLVATRVTRERAHRFYRRQGYDLQKTSHFFEKSL
jgi:GNAT superfamily N-acetyltransferase